MRYPYNKHGIQKAYTNIFGGVPSRWGKTSMFLRYQWFYSGAEERTKG